MSEKFFVPPELKEFRSWYVWGLHGEPQRPWSPVTGRYASPTNPETWGTYEQACMYAETYGAGGIGFVLSHLDPYTMIDLDYTEDPEQVKAQMQVFDTFGNTYSERSPSGKGLHIITKGTVPKGRKRNNIEIYSTARCMRMSGDPYRNIPIIRQQEELTELWESLQAPADHRTGGIQYPDIQIEEDEVLFNKACAAANGDKFKMLWAGKWQDQYETQSEADFALISILTYWTKSRTQIKRLFKWSGLCNREKARRDSYLDLMITKIFDREAQPIDISGIAEQIAAKIDPATVLAKPKSLDCKFPPGLVGEIAEFIYKAVPRPVKEIALIASLGLMSGVCGRAYNVSGTGLNQYYLLLAETGVGKDGIKRGISKLMKPVIDRFPTARRYLGPAYIASAPALINHLSSEQPSFLWIVGEFGVELEAMTRRNATIAKAGLKGLLLDLYGKSGEGDSLDGAIYADKKSNLKSIKAPAVTVLGESVPSRVFDVLSDDLIADGFLPRFLTIQYEGKRPSENEKHNSVFPDSELVERVLNICTYADTLNISNKPTHVAIEDDAKELLRDFNKFCDKLINESSAEIKRQLWNRAHLKVLKLSALVAIGVNFLDPVVTKEHVIWARNLVERDCMTFTDKFERGEMGGGGDEVGQIKCLLEVIREYILTPWDEQSVTAKKAVSRAKAYYDKKIIPYSYLQKRCMQFGKFRNDRWGATKALQRTINSVIDAGYIEELDPLQSKREFNSKARAFALADASFLDK